MWEGTLVCSQLAYLSPSSRATQGVRGSAYKEVLSASIFEGPASLPLPAEAVRALSLEGLACLQNQLQSEVCFSTNRGQCREQRSGSYWNSNFSPSLGLLAASPGKSFAFH